MIKQSRRLIALTAAYALALQAVLAGIAVWPASAHALPEVCAPAGHGPTPGPAPTGTDCVACPAVCGGAGPAGIVSGAFASTVPPVRAFGIAHGIAVAVSHPAPRLLPPTRASPPA